MRKRCVTISSSGNLTDFRNARIGGFTDLDFAVAQVYDAFHTFVLC